MSSISGNLVRIGTLPQSDSETNRVVYLLLKLVEPVPNRNSESNCVVCVVEDDCLTRKSYARDVALAKSGDEMTLEVDWSSDDTCIVKSVNNWTLDILLTRRVQNAFEVGIFS